MIDLHSHTTESDGTDTPAALVAVAVSAGLEALAITDHDTLAGYDAAKGPAQAANLDLLCAIELSTRFSGFNVHLLGYFPNGEPAPAFREWLRAAQWSRADRNRRLVERLRSIGIPITLEEVERKGKSMTGRPHFARVLIEKGYAATVQQAFEEYLDESAKGFVERQETDFAEAVRMINECGGISSLAHPIRVRSKISGSLRDTIATMREDGLRAVEVYHSDHSPADMAAYEAIAQNLGLAVTGGSDYHGFNKPNIRLGTGANGNLNIGRGLLVKLRESVA